MKLAAFLAALALVHGAFAEAVVKTTPRNPFWPIGYKGEATPISPEATGRTRAAPVPAVKPAPAPVVVKPKPVAVAAPVQQKPKVAPPPPPTKNVSDIADTDWMVARRLLKFSNPACFTDSAGVNHYSVNINGRIYADGDLVSVVHEGIRFIWRVVKPADSKSLKLTRVRAISEKEFKSRKEKRK